MIAETCSYVLCVAMFVLLGKAAVALLGALTSILLPEFIHELRDGDGVGVVADQTQHKDTVLTEVVLHEGLEVSPVVVPDVNPVFVVFLHQDDVLLHVAPAVGVEHGAQRPGEETQTGQGGDEDHPEPEEQVDLLVEQVDGQHALDGVALHVAETSNLQVAHRDAREPIRLRPVIASQQLLNHIDTIQVVVGAEEMVEYKQLADDVDDKEYFRDQVERDQVIPLATTTHEAYGARETILEAHCKIRLILALGNQISKTKQQSKFGFLLHNVDRKEK